MTSGIVLGLPAWCAVLLFVATIVCLVTWAPGAIVKSRRIRRAKRSSPWKSKSRK